MGRSRQLAVLAMIALAGFITTLDNTVINVALPSVQRDLGLSLKDLEWVATSYVLSFGALLLVGGRLADLLGRRPVLATGLVIFTVSSVFVGLAGSGSSLIAARTAQGVGAALVIPASLAVVATDLPERRRAFAIGVWTSALAIALALGPLAGGIITEHWGWEWVFYLNVPFGAAALLLTLAVPAVPRAENDDSRLVSVLDVPGVLLSSLALYLLTYGLVEGGAEGFRTAPVPQYLIGAAVTGLLFLIVESRTFLPLVDPGLFRNRALSGGTAAQVLWGIGVNGVFFFTALYLQQILGFSPTKAGLAFLPLAAALLVTTPYAERWSKTLGAHRVIAVGLAAVAGGLVLVSQQGADATYGSLQPGLLLIGAGSALTTPLTIRSLDGVPVTRTGMATGVVSAAREVSGVFGVVLVGVVLTRRERSAIEDGADPATAFLHGYDTGLQLAAGCVLLGALITVVALRRPGRHRARRRAPIPSVGPAARAGSAEHVPADAPTPADTDGFARPVTPLTRPIAYAAPSGAAPSGAAPSGAAPSGAAPARPPGAPTKTAAETATSAPLALPPPPAGAIETAAEGGA
ncbi:MFS transporter [Streptomyces sp. NBC_01803]|uniref:MFS transporter n=1 Tax=Streptomyces sp. NBC_01803 TaxID=2975946 RepID=UPI002DD92BDC|nr:MFS transporter [Streptomyces sp. NBC_01803]WSA46162.1 MFS transporter [Streptomyces sp. NBC_01803]